MSLNCGPGSSLIVSGNQSVCVPYPLQLPQQWAAGQALCLILIAVCLLLTAAAFVQYLMFMKKRHMRQMVFQQYGLIFLFVANVLLLAFAAADPGFFQATTGGFMSPSYMAGHMTLMIFSSCFSAWAVAVLAGFWVNLLTVRSGRGLMGLSLVSNFVVCALIFYYTVISIAFVVCMAYIVPFTFPKLFMGLLAGMTVVVAVGVFACGTIVVRRLESSKKYKSFSSKEQSRIGRVRLGFTAFAVAQILCAVGQYVVLFYEAEINSTAELWIWVGVWYPILLFSLSYYLILFALKYRPGNKSFDNERGRSDSRSTKSTTNSSSDKLRTGFEPGVVEL